MRRVLGKVGNAHCTKSSSSHCPGAGEHSACTMTLKMSGNERMEKTTVGRGRSHSSSARGHSEPIAATGMRSCRCTRACASPARTWLSRTLTMLEMLGFFARALGSPLLVLAVPLCM